jgi:hypothetical protein
MNNHSELLVKVSQRGLWIALSLMLVLGAYALVINLVPDSGAAAAGGHLMTLLPIAIIVAIAAMHSSGKRLRGEPRAKAMQAVLHDELRQQSLHRAYRNALVAVLLAQPALALLTWVTAVPHPMVLMASLTVLAGVATVLGSLLAYDR